MLTVSECMRMHREMAAAGMHAHPGADVLVEARGSEEIVVQDPVPAGMTKRRWETRQIRVEEVERERQNETRIVRMLAFKAHVADDSPVYPLEKRGKNVVRDFFMGRAKRNDIVLDDQTVSSVHAKIEIDGNARVLSDAGSSNGTFLNSQRVSPNAREVLGNGDCIRIGAKVLYFLTGEWFLLFLDLRTGIKTLEDDKISGE